MRENTLSSTNKEDNTKEKNTKKLSNEDLADLFAYCARLASLVSSRDAEHYYGFTFDGAVKDTFYGLAMLYADEGVNRTADDFKSDEFYGPILEQMLTDIRRVLNGDGPH